MPACLLVVALFVVLAFCSYPAADDFNFACSMAGKGFLAVQESWYRDWSGKYFGTLCITAFLAAFGLVERYWLAPLLLIAATFAAAWLAVRGFAGRRLAPREPALAGLALLALFLAGVRGPSESIYWLTAAYEYQVASIGAVLLVALLAMRPTTRAGRIANAAVATVVAFCAVGATETMMAAIVLATLGSWVGTLLVARVRPSARQVAVTAAIVAGATLMIACPGNGVRSSNFPDARQLGPTLLQATGRGLWSLLKWSLNPALLGASLMFLSMAPVLARNGLRRVVRLRPASPLPVVGLVGLVIACMTPSFWAIGFKPPKRAEGNIWVVFLIGWFALVLPFLHARLRARGPFWRSPRAATLGKALLVVGLFVPGNVPWALYDVFGLGAVRYHREEVRRTADVIAARERGTEHVVTVPIEHRPKSLWIEDLTADPANERNVWFARFLGLRSVVAAAVGAGQPAGK